MLKRVVITLIVFACAPAAFGFEPFVVQDIRIDGLQRIAAGTVFNYLPIQIGDTLDSTRSAEAIRALYKTRFFRDVRLERDGGLLIVAVVERPSIAKITVSGNDAIDTEPLLESLKQIGFAEGRVFDSSVLDKVDQDLRRTYFGLGKYDVKIETTTTPLERNRVAVNIDITEGAVARIKRINIVGNDSFDEDDLLDLFKLSKTNWLSWFTKDDQYSKQRLSGDLESLRSHYLDRGFINFNIESTQVSLTPDKKGVFINVNIAEGDRFDIGQVRLAGELPIPEEELFKMVELKKGEVFSRKKVTETINRMVDRLGDEGYAFANVNSIPDIDDDAKQVILTFFVDPGKRVYVRRVNFEGNTRTRDEVLRREIRQMESAWISTSKIKRSQTRLQKLGYFEEVNVETPAVPGTTDQVDVDFSVKEKPSGSFTAGLGFSQTQGVVLNLGLNQDNFLGSGNRVGIAFNNSDVQRTYSFSYDNPFWSVDGVSRGFDLFYKSTDAESANITDYDTDRGGAGVRFGIPISEFQRVRVGLAGEYINLRLGNNPSLQLVDFVRKESDEYTNATITASWRRDTRNRALFPDRGLLTSLAGEVTTPKSDLMYYKLTVRQQIYLPVSKWFTMLLKGEVGFGDGYGDSDELPFFENFFAGGIRSVRGFKDNTLGPRDSLDEPFGGDKKVVGNAELILPAPFLKESRSVRLSAFYDVGNVYGPNEDADAGELRMSTGVAASWLSPVGALTFSLAYPLNDKERDDTQAFQFTFGTLF
ncbi:MAG: outer membrane protein assembly factor BamA [Gammaproteobacteria bacterium]|nr:outer membrane protein assembly factor BamA [Gammaproteobacteria bacterium]